MTISRLFFSGALVALVGISTAHAGPGGNPFVRLETRIDGLEASVGDLQDRMDAVVERVDDIDERVQANQAAIAALQASNADLQAQIDAGSDARAALATRITANEGLIVGLQDQVAVIEALLEEAEQIDAGLCPEGTQLRLYNAQPPQLQCAPLNWPQSSGTIALKTARFAPGQVTQIRFGCADEIAAKQATNLTISQSGALQVLNVQWQGSGFAVAVRNPTGAWETGNFRMLCTSLL